jgi:hypothetical protein
MKTHLIAILNLPISFSLAGEQEYLKSKRPVLSQPVVNVPLTTFLPHTVRRPTNNNDFPWRSMKLTADQRMHVAVTSPDSADHQPGWASFQAMLTARRRTQRRPS